MDIKKETQQKIQEIQILEQNLNQILMQKQAFQMELNESQNALSEIKTSKDDIFKLIGQIMIKADKKKTEQELTKKNDLLTLRLRSIEKQEEEFNHHVEKLREEIMKEIK
jgi:prefoldin beta subunit